MIGIFKINDPIRLGLLFLLLVVIRLPFLMYDLPTLKPELLWFLIGEKINDGWVMYQDLDDNTGVLSALVYSIVNSIAGRSVSFLNWISLVLVFLQAITFNFFLNELNVVKERSLLPALLYVICSSIFIDFYTLSPPLIATTFLILALRYLFILMKQERKEASGFLMGMYIGISVLCYTSSFVYILFFLFSMLLFTSISIRKSFMVVWGFLFPLLIVATYYTLNSAFTVYAKDILYYSFTQLNYWYLSPSSILLFASLPIAMLVLALLKLSGRAGYVNYQNNARTVMVLYLFASFFVFFISPKKSAYHLCMALPAMSLILGEYFLSFNKKRLRNFIFYSFSISLICLGYSYDSSPFIVNKFIKSEEIISEDLNLSTDGKVLVLGDAVDYYLNNEAATGYLNWQVAKQRFDNLRDVRELLDVKKSFERDLPDLIIDKENVIPTIFDMLPSLGNSYSYEGEGIYVLKKPSI